MRKILKNSISYTLILSLTGCSSMAVNYTTTKIAEDKIISVGAIEHESTSKIIFIGENYTFLADRGGQKLLNIINNTKDEQRILVNQLPISFHMENDNQFSGSLGIRFSVPIYQLSEEEYQKLKKLGFNSQSTHCSSALVPEYQCEYPYTEIDLTGTIYTSSDNQNLLDHKLKQPYPIIIYERIPQKKSRNIGKKIIAAPFVVAGVIIMTPIILGVAILNAGNPDAWK